MRDTSRSTQVTMAPKERAVTEFVIRDERLPDGEMALECVVRLRSGVAVIDRRSTRHAVWKATEVQQLVMSLQDALLRHLATSDGVQLSLDA